MSKKRTQLTFTSIPSSPSTPTKAKEVVAVDPWEKFNQTRTCYREGQDAFALDSLSPGNVGKDLRSELLERVRPEASLHARNILTFENGTVVSKHQAPWGDNSCLYEKVFIINKKVFTLNGDVLAVHIRARDDESREYVLNKAFFQGWLDAYSIEACHDFFIF